MIFTYVRPIISLDDVDASLHWVFKAYKHFFLIKSKRNTNHNQSKTDIYLLIEEIYLSIQTVCVYIAYKIDRYLLNNINEKSNITRGY